MARTMSDTANVHAGLVRSNAEGGAWLLTIWDNEGDVEDHHAFLNPKAAKAFAEREAGRSLDWIPRGPGRFSADWES